MTISATGLRNRTNDRPLGDWSQAKKITIRPQPKADITKVIFAEVKWVVPKR